MKNGDPYKQKEGTLLEACQNDQQSFYATKSIKNSDALNTFPPIDALNIRREKNKSKILGGPAKHAMDSVMCSEQGQRKSENTSLVEGETLLEVSDLNYSLAFWKL